jgi:isopentenyldiphosphate isomerase
MNKRYLAPSRPALPPVTPGELIEIVDGRDRPLAAMDISDAHRQSLSHRAVLILVYDPGRKIYLQRRSLAKALYPGRWDVSASGHVKAGESREDAALRELYEEIGISAAGLKLLTEVPAGPETGFEFVSVFSAGTVRETPQPNAAEVQGGFFCDRTELAGLVERCPELLTPGLVYVWEQNFLFPPDMRS